MVNVKTWLIVHKSSCALDKEYFYVKTNFTGSNDDNNNDNNTLNLIVLKLIIIPLRDNSCIVINVI